MLSLSTTHNRLESCKRLDEGLSLDHQLTLVSAPAGCGKTTLLSEWVAQMRAGQAPSRTTWLSLEQEDNVVARCCNRCMPTLDEKK